MEIVWTTSSQEDLRLIYLFYLAKSERVADNVYNDIIKETSLLNNFPYIAQIEPLLKNRPLIYRSLVVRSIFKVIYYIEEEKIYITTVWDCRRNPEALIEYI